MKFLRQVLTVLVICAAPITLLAQEFKLFHETFQVHGFASEGFAYTNQNNYLTMKTSDGSSFTDFGFSVSSRLTDKLRVGAQFYDRDIGHLQEWHPLLDWAVVDYRFRDWLGVRGGKVKTALGLYYQTQDYESLRRGAR